MVAYRLDGIQGSPTHTPSRGLSQSTRSIADYISETRIAANEYQHPVAIFDLEGQPIFRNSALAARLTSEQQSQSSDRTWQLVYAAACKIVDESIVGRAGISTIVAVERRSFAILGSLLRQASGTVYGATAHIAEVTNDLPNEHASDSGSYSSASGTQCSDVEDREFQSWLQRRDEARSRMQRLSPRETEVVSHVSAGLPNKSIARELEISVKTIEKHRANAVRKLGVTSTPGMVRISVLADNELQTAPPEPARALLNSVVSAGNPPQFSIDSERGILH
jgi:DNA-binding CsgD family transcriptional regulator